MANMIDFGFRGNGREWFKEPFERGRREIV
jgi:hypothetical protein